MIKFAVKLPKEKPSKSAPQVESKKRIANSAETLSLIERLYDAGESVRLAAHKSAEVLKVGGLRGGSTGMLLYGKTPVGQCARKAYLRFKGIDLNDAEDDRQLMFDAGLRNEDSWAENLQRGIEELGESYTIKREEEIAVAWQLKDGTRVTGRPDMVVMKDDKPMLLLELKLVSSLWTAKDLLIYGMPKLPHILQCAHYLRQIQEGNFLGSKGEKYPDVQAEIWYTSRADFAISGEPWAQKLFKQAPAHYMDWKETSEGPGPLKVLPFKMGFLIKFTPQGQLIYQRIGTGAHPGDGKWHYSVATWESIEAFFDTVTATDKTGVLPVRPGNVDAAGEKASWSPCKAQYCVLSATCDKHESNKDKWLKEAQKIAEERAK